MSVRSIKSAERTLALFELFAAREQGLRVGEVAIALAIPQPSATMILRNLTELGYLEYDRETRRYGPTIRVMLLGSWINRRFGGASELPQILSDLFEACGHETVWLGIQSGTKLRYIAAIQARHPDRLVVTAGHLHSLTCSAGGQALLSRLPDQEIAGWVRHCNADSDLDRLRVNLRDYIATIEQVRHCGYAETHGKLVPGTSGIAVTLPAPVGETPLALGVGGPTATIRSIKTEVVAALLQQRDRFCAGLRDEPSLREVGRPQLVPTGYN